LKKSNYQVLASRFVFSHTHGPCLNFQKGIVLDISEPEHGQNLNPPIIYVKNKKSPDTNGFFNKTYTGGLKKDKYHGYGKYEF